MFIVSHLINHYIPQRAKTLLKKTLSRLYGDRSFTPYIKKKNIEGAVFDFWIGDAEGRDWYDLSCTDPVWVELRFMKDHIIEQGDVILECGAHHGCTTIALSQWIGDKGKLIAFEPVYKNCDIIQKNLELNKISNVMLVRKAVGAENGRTEISGASNSSVVIAKHGTEVELTCLDEYLSFQPSFLKIDVEGYEVNVLRGAKRILSQHPKLAIEIHTDALLQYGVSVAELFSLIDVDAYEMWVQWNDGEEPQPYTMQLPITKRVHLFCIPKPQALKG